MVALLFELFCDNNRIIGFGQLEEFVYDHQNSNKFKIVNCLRLGFKGTRNEFVYLAKI